MERFYTHLREPGGSKAAAFQKAQLELLKKYPHPYYWAPFALAGKFRDR